MEDDFHDGQKYVMKWKKKSGKHEFATTVKVGEEKEGSHKLAVEEKVKTKMAEMGGMQFECKFKNSGDVSYEMESDCLKGIEGLEGAQLLWKGTISSKNAPFQLGLEFDNDFIKSKTYMTASATPKFLSEFSYRACPCMTVAEKTEFDVQNPGKTLQSEIGFAGHFEKVVQYGSHTKIGELNGSVQPTYSSLYFNHENGGNAAGAQMDYDYATKKFATKLGLKFKEEDHTLKLRFQDNGMARAALQWQLHKAVKATVTTEMNLNDVPAGKTGALPWGLAFEVKY